MIWEGPGTEPRFPPSVILTLDPLVGNIIIPQREINVEITLSNPVRSWRKRARPREGRGLIQRHIVEPGPQARSKEPKANLIPSEII